MKVELVTNLKRQATRILADLHMSKEPVLITEHGKPSAYLVDVQDYEFMQRRLELLEGLSRGERAVLEGRTYSQREARENEQMAEVIWTEPAVQDLDSIAEYIALDNPAAASELVQEVFDKIERLGTFPQSGRVPPELPNSVYREVVVSPCRIFYREDEKRVLVLCVMREERQLRAFMLGHG